MKAEFTDRGTPPMAAHRSTPERLLFIPEAADILRISEKTLRRWITNGEIAIVRNGRIIRIEPSAIRMFVSQHRID
jgi:excisionase family DNA binding protein